LFLAQKRVNYTVMPISSTTWKEGQSPNPNGRTRGSRNRRNSELWARLEARGDKDPADLLSEIVTNENEQKELRIQAAGMLMPYKYAKVTAPAPTVFIDQTININRPTSIREARANIAYISELKSQGKLDLVAADSLISDQRALLDSFIDETKLLVAGQSDQPQAIQILGGLPRLPGCNVTMPGDPPYEPKPNGGDPTTHDHTHAPSHNEEEHR
jgi:hypothetical protein